MAKKAHTSLRQQCGLDIEALLPELGAHSDTGGMLLIFET